MTSELITRQSAPARGMTLSTFEQYMRFAQVLCESGLAPQGRKPERVLVCLQYGAEIGLSPMNAVQNIMVVNGKPALYGDAMLGVCRSSGLFDDSEFTETISGTGDSREAVCRLRRLPNGRATESRFSVADAKAAGLWGKSGPWKQYPNRMLQMRARSFALRDTFPDVLKGLVAVEEVRDYQSVSVIDAGPAPPAQAEADNIVEAVFESKPQAEGDSDLNQPLMSNPTQKEMVIRLAGELGKQPGDIAAIVKKRQKADGTPCEKFADLTFEQADTILGRLAQLRDQHKPPTEENKPPF